VAEGVEAHRRSQQPRGRKRGPVRDYHDHQYAAS
jgi:hypothetical protein